MTTSFISTGFYARMLRTHELCALMLKTPRRLQDHLQWSAGSRPSRKVLSVAFTLKDREIFAGKFASYLGY